MQKIAALLLLTPSFLAMAWLVTKAQHFWDTRPDLQFGWVVLLLCAYLFWEAWEKHPPIDFRARWWCVLLFIFGGVLLFWVQIYLAALGLNAASLYGMGLGVMAMVAANLGVVFGWRGVRHFAMSFVFLFVALPLPSIIQGRVVNGLQHHVAAIDVNILNLLGIPAEQVGSLVHLSTGTVGIDEACSGIRSLQSTIMATVFIGYLSLRRFSFQVLLLLSGVTLAIVGNLIRSLYLCLTANARGIDAVKEVHDAAGWSILVFTAIGVILISWLFNKMDKTLAAVQEPSQVKVQTASPPLAKSES